MTPARLRARRPIDSVPGLTPAQDVKGNLLHDPYAPRYNDPNVGQLYAWDGENRLIRVTTDDGTPVTPLEIEYDALGWRILSWRC